MFICRQTKRIIQNYIQVLPGVFPELTNINKTKVNNICGKLCVPASYSMNQNSELMLGQPIVYAWRHVVQCLFFSLSGITLHFNECF